MKNLVTCIAILGLVFITGCGKSDVLEDLYGSWTSTAVFVDLGVTEGQSTLQFNEDGTYKFFARFNNIVTGCAEAFSDSGTFTGDELKVQFTATTGERETLFCNDPDINMENQPYSEIELERVSYSAEWKIVENTLTMEYSDGSTREYMR